MSDCVATMRLNCAARACIHRMAASVRSSRSVRWSMAAPSPRSRRCGRARRRGMPDILQSASPWCNDVQAPTSATRQQQHRAIQRARACSLSPRQVPAAFFRRYAARAPRPFQVWRRVSLACALLHPALRLRPFTLVDDASASGRDDDHVRRVPRVCAPKAVLAFTYRDSTSYLFCSQCQHVWNTRTPTECCKPHVPL
jgi:hypothetical protein